MPDKSMQKILSGVDVAAKSIPSIRGTYAKEIAEAKASNEAHRKGMADKRADADKVYRKLTGKGLNSEEGWMGQIHDAMLDAHKRGTLSTENAKKYRERLMGKDD